MKRVIVAGYMVFADRLKASLSSARRRQARCAVGVDVSASLQRSPGRPVLRSIRVGCSGQRSARHESGRTFEVHAIQGKLSVFMYHRCRPMGGGRLLWRWNVRNTDRCSHRNAEDGDGERWLQ